MLWKEHSHCQDFDVHNLLLELLAHSGVVLKGAVIASQIPEEIKQSHRLPKPVQRNAIKETIVTTKCAGLTMNELEV